jgi:hypothetical protein
MGRSCPTYGGEKHTEKDSGNNFIGKSPVGKLRKRWFNAVEIGQEGDLESEKLEKRSSR